MGTDKYPCWISFKHEENNKIKLEKLFGKDNIICLKLGAKLPKDFHEMKEKNIKLYPNKIIIYGEERYTNIQFNIKSIGWIHIKLNIPIPDHNKAHTGGRILSL